MTSDQQTVSVVIIAHRSTPALAAAVRSAVTQGHRPLELVLFANGGALDVPAGVPADVPVRTGASARNLGVAGGRNAAARLATGDALLFLDDDAVLRPAALAAAVEALFGAPDVGAVAFNVIDPVSGRPALWHHHPLGPEHSGRAFDTTTVIGCGNLVRRDVFEELGGFWDGYFREVEEVDLSWRMIDAGRRIRYEPRAAVEHPERTEPHFGYAVASNLLLVWRLMPGRTAVRQTLFLLALFAARAARRRAPGALAGGLRTALRHAARARRERTPLSPATLAWLRAVNARPGEGLGKRIRWSVRPRRLEVSAAR